MKIRAILETETMDFDFKEPFLNGMPFDITESTFDRYDSWEDTIEDLIEDLCTTYQELYEA